MTKMHFIALAEAIRQSNGTHDQKMFAATIVADTARSFNGRFDRNRFFAACGLELS